MKTKLILLAFATTASLLLSSCGAMGNLANGMRFTPNSHQWYYPGEGDTVTGSSYPRPATRNATYCPHTGRLVDPAL